MSGTASEQVTLDVTDWLKPVGLCKSYYILVYFLPLAGIVQNGIGQTVDCGLLCVIFLELFSISVM